MPPAALRIPSSAAYRELTQGYEDIIRQITLAPELPQAITLGQSQAAHGVRVQAGHTDADFPPRGELLTQALQGCATHSTLAGRCTIAIPALWLLRCWTTVLPPSASATLSIYTPEHCS